MASDAELLDRADAWIDRVLKRADELRTKGVLSVAVDGCSATYAPGLPLVDESDDDDASGVELQVEESDPWRNPASYPTGNVPEYERDEGELPPIPELPPITPRRDGVE